MTDKIISPSLLKTFLSCIASKFAKKSEIPDISQCVKSSKAAAIWVGTQAEYDAIQTKDAKTVYLVIES